MVPARRGRRASAGRWFPGSPAKAADQRPDRIEVDIVHALLERDDRVVRDVDVLRTHLGAALCDVALPAARLSLQLRTPVDRILGVHLQARDPDQETGTVEGILQVVVAYDVADVLAQEALDAFAELHHALDIL